MPLLLDILMSSRYSAMDDYISKTFQFVIIQTSIYITHLNGQWKQWSNKLYTAPFNFSSWDFYIFLMKAMITKGKCCIRLSMIFTDKASFTITIHHTFFQGNDNLPVREWRLIMSGIISEIKRNRNSYCLQICCFDWNLQFYWFMEKTKSKYKECHFEMIN